jgi:hypothetical protein
VRVFLHCCVNVSAMEGKIELKDPDHPEAEKAAEATARLLIEIRDTRTNPQPKEGATCPQNESSASPN